MHGDDYLRWVADLTVSDVLPSGLQCGELVCAEEYGNANDFDNHPGVRETVPRVYHDVRTLGASAQQWQTYWLATRHYG